MGKDQSAAPGGDKSDSSLYFLLVLLVLGFLSKALWPWITRARYFWWTHSHQLILCFWFCSGVFLLIALARFWNHSIETQSEKAITDADDSSVYLGDDTQTKKPIHLK